jgi:hypothetical protein
MKLCWGFRSPVRILRMNVRGRVALASALICALMLLGASKALATAVLLPAGANLPAPATTAAAEPDLDGVVVSDTLVPFTIKAADGAVLCTGQLQDRVVRSNKTAELDFYYRIRDTHGPGEVEQLATSSFENRLLRVAYRTDGLGTVPPTMVARSAAPGKSVSFNFTNQHVSCARRQESQFIVIETGAKTFGAGSETQIVVTTGVKASVATVTPTGTLPPSTWEVSGMQPDVKEGGRVNGIAVDPSNDENVLVTSESGGMFVSKDRGQTWKHIDSLPVFQTNAVVLVPAKPSVAIVTASADYRAVNGGGIWRSTDGGVKWTQVPNPPMPANANGPMSATEISIAPDTGDIYVASNFGVSVSTDQGMHWTQTQPFTSGDPSVASVVAQSRGRILAGASTGVMRSLDGGTHWLTPTTNTDGISDLHAFGRSPFSPDQAYVVDEKNAGVNTR